MAEGIIFPNVGNAFAQVEALRSNALRDRLLMAQANREESEQARKSQALGIIGSGGADAAQRAFAIHPEIATQYQNFRTAGDEASVRRMQENATWVAQRGMAIESAPEADRPALYEQARQEALAKGIPPNRMPATYNPGWVRAQIAQAQSVADYVRENKPQVGTVGATDGSGRKQTAIINPQTGAMRPIGGPMGEQNPLSSTDRKAIFEAEDENAKLASTVSALQRAKELAPKAFNGYLASMRGSIGTNVPYLSGLVGGEDSAKATRELDQLMSSEAIQAMSQTLKGASTDREMFEFKRIMGDPTLPPDLKIRTIDRMLKAAERQAQVNADRMNQLRGGTYFKPGGGQPSPSPAQTPAPTQTQPAPVSPPAPTQPAPTGPPRISTQEEYQSLPPGTEYIAPDGSTRTKR